MPEEFQKFGSHFGRSATEILLGQRVEQFCLGLIVESIFSRPGDFAGIKIVVGQIQPAGADLSSAVAGSDLESR